MTGAPGVTRVRPFSNLFETMTATAESYADPTRSFQALILTLQNFWAKQGCVVLQPYDMEVGAGTFHPATTLRSLGPRAWKAA